MTIIILALMIYSIFGVHMSLEFGHIGQWKIEVNTESICIIVATILYCIERF